MIKKITLEIFHQAALADFESFLFVIGQGHEEPFETTSFGMVGIGLQDLIGKLESFLILFFIIEFNQRLEVGLIFLAKRIGDVVQNH